MSVAGPPRRPRPLRSASFTAAGVAVAIATDLAVAWAFWPVYGTAAFWRMAVVAILAGTALAVAGARLKLPAAAVVVAGLAVTVVGGAVLAVPSETVGGVLPTADGLRDLVSSLALGWARLVTLPPPVGSYQAVLAPAWLVLIACALVTGTVALRTSRPELAVVAPLAASGVAIALGPQSVARPVAPAVLLVGVSALWLAGLRTRRRVRASRSLGLGHAPRLAPLVRHTVVTVLLVALAAAVGAGAASAAAPTVPRTVVRTVVAQPFDVRSYASPLAGFRAYEQPARADEPMLEVSGLGASRRIRIATLDDYDGVVYGLGSGAGSGVFQRVPTRLAPRVDGGVPVTLHVTVRGYHGPWVPAGGSLVATAFDGRDAAALADGFVYDRATGDQATTARLASGDRYVTQVVERPMADIRDLAAATPGPADLPSPEGVPDELDAALARYAGGASTPGGKLSAALAGLVSEGYVSHGQAGEPFSRSGHSADRITQLLTDRPMLGDAEQYAVTAALMARRLGFPARVAMGFEAPAGASGGRVVLTGSDVTAWLEIDTAAGWVSVDPNPPARAVPPKTPDAPEQISRPQSIVQPPDDDSTRLQPAPQVQSDDRPDPRPDPFAAVLSAALAVGGVVLAVLALAATPVLLVVAAKRRRRTLRRRSATARARILGGWSEYRDAAVDHGLVAARTATRRETAAAMGGTRPARLAAVTDRAVYAPDDPTEAEAERVWSAVEEMVRALDRGLTRRRRLAAAVSLRSLLAGSEARRRRGTSR